MSTVLWVHYLRADSVENDEFDLRQMYRHARKLDKLARRIGVGKLSDFYDETDLLVNLGRKECPEDESTYHLMVEEGSWFDPSDGLEVVDGLLAELRARPVRFGLLSDGYADVVAELEHCRESIQRAAEEGSRFSLGVVM